MFKTNTECNLRIKKADQMAVTLIELRPRPPPPSNTHKNIQM